MSDTSQNIATESVEKQLSDLKAQNAALTEQVTAYEKALTTQEELVASKDAEIAKMAGALAEAEKLVLDQQAQLAKQPEVIVSSEPVITYKKVQYRIAIPSFYHKGEPYTAEDLKKNSVLVAALIESSSAVLVPVEKKL